MGKAAVLTVLTERNLVRVKVAELGFVLVPVVQAFNTVVSTFAAIMLRTLFSLGELTELWGVAAIVPSLVLDGVKVEARLMIMGTSTIRTFEALEVTQKKVFDGDRQLGFVVTLLDFREDLPVFFF